VGLRRPLCFKNGDIFEKYQGVAKGESQGGAVTAGWCAMLQGYWLLRERCVDIVVSL
jgi:hypothetical protein